ncbi:hypothetical protein V0R48_18520 [Pseudomonas alcaligenes]|uniref:hypothetical protein n=1 Tax=Aquipseudomonas alcaligenes TaxID=43263 RepID=UPI002E7ACC37|nr:hypothetical protein [Pseudomonas alcaligenes]MEE1950979.1 hypothetical protein [Pseudomonas alcaligenes]
MPGWLKWVLVAVVLQVLIGIAIEAVNRWVLPPTASEAGSLLLSWYHSFAGWLAEPSGFSNGRVIGLVLALVGVYVVGDVAWSFYGNRKHPRKIILTAAPMPAAPPPFEPNILQNKILLRFWELNPDKRESATSLAAYVEYSANEVAHALDTLFEEGLVKDSLNQLTGRSFFLSVKGRQLCAERFGHAAAMAKPGGK